MHDNHDESPIWLGQRSRAWVCVGRALRTLKTVSCAGAIVSCAGLPPPAEAPAQAATRPAEELTYANESAASGGREQAPSDEVQPAPAAPEDFDVESDESVPDEKEQYKARRSDTAQALDEYDLPQALSAIGSFDAKLSAAIALNVPDCEQAETFRRAVCRLAERICKLEQPLPNTVERHCADSRSRCANATSRHQERCER